MPGTIFIVATPIGNLEDITLRARKTLEQADRILAEDTRRTRALLSAMGIHKPVESFHQHNQLQKIPEIIQELKAGKNFALTTDAGTPAVSDPGAKLIQVCLENQIQVVPVPGPSAITTALSASGLPADRFLFLGFLPAKTQERKKLLQKFKDFPETIVLFEAPHRILKTLQDLLETFGDRKVCLCRELTKLYEEIKLTSLSQLLEDVSLQTPKGEFTLVIEGARKENINKINEQQENLDKLVEQLMVQGKSVKDIVSELYLQTGFPKNMLYQKVLQLKKIK